MSILVQTSGRCMYAPTCKGWLKVAESLTSLLGLASENVLVEWDQGSLQEQILPCEWAMGLSPARREFWFFFQDLLVWDS